jgi:hypothetical protein
MNKEVEKPVVVKVPDPVKVVPPTPTPAPVQTPTASKSVSETKEAAMNKEVEKPVAVKAPDPIKVTVSPVVTTPVALKSINDKKEAELTKELDKTSQAVITPLKVETTQPLTLFDTMIDTIIKKTDQINTVLTTVIANQPDAAMQTNNKAAEDAKKLKDSDIVGSINTNTGGLPTGNSVITKTPTGYVVKPVVTPLKETGQVEGTSGQVIASNSTQLLAAQQKIEYDRFGKTIADLRKEAQAIGANGIDYIISQNLGTMTKTEFIENTKNYITSSYNQVVKGNYSPDDVTLLGTSIQVLAGVFGVDLVTDLRDLSADLINFQATGDHALQTGVDALGLIPVIGLGKYADEVKTLVKKANDYRDAVDAPVSILKKADEVPVTKVTGDLNPSVIVDKPLIDTPRITEVTEGGVDDFVGILKGEKVTLPNVKGQTIQYTKVSSENLAELRKAFNTTDRKEFLSYLSNDKDMLQQLKTAGLTDTDILKMKNGYVPTGYQVHHKIPLDGGGTNSLDNLVLIKNDPYHKVITNTQNSVTSGLDAGQTIKIDNWPIPDGKIYPINE